MKYILKPGELIKNKFDIITKLQYLDEAGYKGKGMRYIKVLCTSCNTEHIKQFASIKAGYISTCGNKQCKISTSNFHKIIYKIGENVANTTFTYIEEDLEKSTSNHRYFKVKCSCGDIISTRIDKVKGTCRKCANNLRKDSFTEQHKLSLIKSLITSYNKGAINRKYSFNLSFDIFNKLIFQDCYYCGDLPGNKITKGNKSMYYNGIDRKDNNLGYDESNCVSCCAKCNMMKNKWSHNDFIDHLLKITNNLNLKKNAPICT
jgi:hypothetical protein